MELIFYLSCTQPDLLQYLHLIPKSEKPGASSLDILSLPVYQFHHSTYMNEKYSSATADKPPPPPPPPTLFIPQAQDQFCVICQSKYQDDQIICKLWCDHHFCKKCIFEWLKLDAKCPLCKRDCRRKTDQILPV
jgi:hypothetical protein